MWHSINQSESWNGCDHQRYNTHHLHWSNFLEGHKTEKRDICAELVGDVWNRNYDTKLFAIICCFFVCVFLINKRNIRKGTVKKSTEQSQWLWFGKSVCYTSTKQPWLRICILEGNMVVLSLRTLGGLWHNSTRRLEA